MKFKILASIIVLAAIALAFVVSGGLDGTTNSQPRRDDGIKLIP